MILAKTNFTHEKEKYLLIIETDGIKLKLSCYLGSSQKGKLIRVSKGSTLRNKLLEVVKQKHGTFLAYNLNSPEKIRPDVRTEFKISYPATPLMIELKDTLINRGIIQVEGTKAGKFEDYLISENIIFGRFDLQGEETFVTSGEKVQELIHQNNLAIKNLEKMNYFLVNLRDDLNQQ